MCAWWWWWWWGGGPCGQRLGKQDEVWCPQHQDYTRSYAIWVFQMLLCNQDQLDAQPTGYNGQGVPVDAGQDTVPCTALVWVFTA